MWGCAGVPWQSGAGDSERDGKKSDASHHKLEERGGIGSNLRTGSLSAVVRDVDSGGAMLACNKIRRVILR
jgi:hypothetical protein